MVDHQSSSHPSDAPTGQPHPIRLTPLPHSQWWTTTSNPICAPRSTNSLPALSLLPMVYHLNQSICCPFNAPTGRGNSTGYLIRFLIEIFPPFLRLVNPHAGLRKDDWRVITGCWYRQDPICAFSTVSLLFSISMIPSLHLLSLSSLKQQDLFVNLHPLLSPRLSLHLVPSSLPLFFSICFLFSLSCLYPQFLSSFLSSWHFIFSLLRLSVYLRRYHLPRECVSGC